MPGGSPERHYFPTTHWSLIGRAVEDQTEALNQLLGLYSPALRSYLMVKKRMDANDADDMVQAFIENKVLEHDLVARADSDRGKFRTLLATALDRYVANEYERRMAKKRAPDRAASLSDEANEGFARQEADTDTFEVAWARETLAAALQRMEQECTDSKRPDIWEVFQGRVVAPMLENAAPTPYEEMIERFQYRSPMQASNALTTGKRMFRRALRSVVADYATNDEEVEDEIRDLISVLCS